MSEPANAWTAGPKAQLDYEKLNQPFVPSAADEAGVDEANPEIERELFSGELKPAGEALKALELKVTFEGVNITDLKPVNNFADADLHPVVLQNIKLCGYDLPTAIQAHCIPALLKENDIVAVSQTGSGKTAAYLIPIVSKLMGRVSKIGGPRIDTRAVDYNPERDRVIAQPLVVIICPTRELAHQIFNEARRISYRSKLIPACVYGGTPVKYNIQQLSKGCDILIGTPGRMVDLMDKPHILSMAKVK